MAIPNFIDIVVQNASVEVEGNQIGGSDTFNGIFSTKQVLLDAQDPASNFVVLGQDSRGVITSSGSVVSVGSYTTSANTDIQVLDGGSDFVFVVSLQPGVSGSQTTELPIVPSFNDKYIWS